MIQLKNVTKRYDRLVAVDNITLAIPEGSLSVLLGRSGCGKTTTLRLVAGLERPDRGEIWLDGVAVSTAQAWIPAEKRRIGMVFQDYALFPHLSVAQNIAFPLNELNRRQKTARIADLLDLVGLIGVEKRFPHQLSGGQQQRVALARALAPSPAVVLLDEPFSNLDASLRQSMREEIRRILKEAQATAIFVTHDQEEAMRLADELVVMEAGKILQYGTPASLYHMPNSHDVANFLGESNLIVGDAKGNLVETALGTLPLAYAKNGAVEVMLRPETLEIAHQTETNATIVASRYFGFYKLLDVRHDSGLTLKVRTWSHHQEAVGERVNLRVIGEVIALPPR